MYAQLEETIVIVRNAAEEIAETNPTLSRQFINLFYAISEEKSELFAYNWLIEQINSGDFTRFNAAVKHYSVR